MIRFLVIFFALSCVTARLHSSIWEFFSYLLLYSEEEVEVQESETQKAPRSDHSNIIVLVDEDVLKAQSKAEENKVSKEELSHEELGDEPMPIHLQTHNDPEEPEVLLPNIQDNKNESVVSSEYEMIHSEILSPESELKLSPERESESLTFVESETITPETITSESEILAFEEPPLQSSVEEGSSEIFDEATPSEITSLLDEEKEVEEIIFENDPILDEDSLCENELTSAAHFQEQNSDLEIFESPGMIEEREVSHSTIDDSSVSEQVMPRERFVEEGKTEILSQIELPSAPFYKKGVGHLILEEGVSYGGLLTIEEGSVEAHVSQLSGCVHNEGTFILKSDKEKHFLNLQVSGCGSMIKQGSGALGLHKSCNQKRLCIEEGEVFSKPRYLPLYVEVGPRGKLRIDASDNECYEGFLSGEGPIHIEKGGLELNRAHTCAGEMHLDKAHLILNGGVHDVFVCQDSKLSGVGQMHHLKSKGKIAPGNSIGTLVVTGDFTQEETGLLSIEINGRGATDRVLITGDADIAGSLEILPEKGVYRAGIRYPFLVANSVDGTFDTVINPYPNLFALQYGLNSIELLTTTTAFILPVDFENLRGNGRRMADYLYGDSFEAGDPDLSLAIQILTSLAPQFFEEGLIKFSPLIYGSLPKLDLQNDIRMSGLMTHQFRQICSCIVHKPKRKRRLFRRAKGRSYMKKRHRKYCLPDRMQGAWAEPIGFYYQQKQTQGELSNEGQPAFDAYTYGFGGGYSRIVAKRWLVNGGIGYTHSNIFWRDDLGHGGVNTLYLAPSVGYFTEELYANFLFQSSFNFYKVQRRIHIGGLKREARSLFMFYDYLFQLEGGKAFKIKPKWFLRPEGQFNYLYMSSQLFTEQGAGSLALKVDKQKVSYFQPNVLVRLIREFWLPRGCLSPSIYIGWLANVPIGEKGIQARFEGEQTNRTRLNVVTYLETTNQMTVGLNVPFQSYRNLTLSGGYEANFLSRYQIHQVNFKAQWDF